MPSSIGHPLPWARHRGRDSASPSHLGGLSTMLRALMYLLPLALTIYAFIDCLNTPEDEAKHLPKVAWIFIILLFWIVGPIVWLVAGKLRNVPEGGRTPSEWHRR